MRVLQPVRPAELGGLAAETKELSKLLGDDHDLFMLEVAANNAGLAPRELELALTAMHTRRIELQQEAFNLGRRIYAEEAKAFGRRLRTCGKKWRN